MKMKVLVSGIFCVLFLVLESAMCEIPNGRGSDQATTPPRGWNSYDSFCWVVSEEEFLQIAQLVSKRLHSHGYEFVVVDYLWYRRNVEGSNVYSYGYDVIDEWGRMVPDPARWPSSHGGKGFSLVAKRVHSMGLKFGIHVMRGISTRAFNSNTPILDTTTGAAYEEGGRVWRARDIGIKERSCAWMPDCFMSVNTKLGAGRAFLRSLYLQYAEWGVDFVKHDCVFGDDLDIGEITAVSEILGKLERPIFYSLSPGTSVTPIMAKQVNGLVNMYRITGDDWDKWGDVAAHFDVASDFASSSMIGAQGFRGKSWPDLDMLPLGWLTDQGTNRGPYRHSNLTYNEQKTQMTLWAMVKSPLMFGGDLRRLDETTYNLITNPVVLEINAFSSNNKEFPYITQQSGRLRKAGTSHTRFLSLVSCKEGIANGWSVEVVEKDLHQVCWKKNPGTHHLPFCLYKRNLPLALEEELVSKPHFEGKTHLLPSTEAESVCLEAAARKRLTSEEFRRGSLSPCKWVANQMWELNGNGTLINSYSGLCATVKTVKGNLVSSEGVRSWVATGRRGEVYVAFFNLNQETSLISAKLSDVEKMLPGRKLDGSTCKCREVWSGHGYRIRRASISADVEPHGTIPFQNLNFNSKTKRGSSIKPNLTIPRIFDCLNTRPPSLSWREGAVSLRLQRLVSEFRSRPEPIDRVRKLLDYAAVQPWLSESARSPENRVAGCAAQVWLEVEKDELLRMRFGADSDSEIVKAEDLEDMNIGLPVRSRVNSWPSLLINMQERTCSL
ncbi:hypothetical protein V2J09_013146 [Rumex salicifolius]